MSLSTSDCCLKNTTILCKKHTIFLALSLRNLSIPNRDIGAKLPSQRLGSAGPLAWYGMTEGSIHGFGSMSLVEGCAVNSRCV